LSGENQRWPGWIVVARVLRPRGNKGEVAVELLTDFPERLTKVQEVFLGRVQGESPAAKFVGAFGTSEPTPIGVKSCWLSQNHRGQGVFHFAGVHSINDAEKFRGLDVLLPFEQRVSLPAGQFFVADLIGCGVFETAACGTPAVASSPCSMATAPQLLGTVRDVQFPGESERVRGTPLLEVDTGQGELLIPLAEDICKRIDAAARRIEVTLPEGLRDLNSE
jgi:16S rRNA processing protein RimM